MFAADAELETGAGFAAAVGGDLNQFPDTDRVERHERVVLQDAVALIGRQKASGIVTR